MPGKRSAFKKAKVAEEEEEDMMPEAEGPKSTPASEGKKKKGRKSEKERGSHAVEEEEHTPNGISDERLMNGALSDADSEQEDTAGDDMQGETKKKRKRSKKLSESAPAPEPKAAAAPPPAKKKRETSGERADSDKKRERKRQTAKEEEEGRAIKVHVSRFVEYQPQSITAMAYDPRGRRLAVARGNGDIQLWSTVAPRWHPIATLAGSTHRKIRDEDGDDSKEEEEEEEGGKPAGPGRREAKGKAKGKKASAEAKGELRLLSGSLDGTITEWSLESLAPVSVTDSHGGSIWSMAVSGSGELLAVGCHDGGVRLFDLSGGDVTFKKGLQPHPGQILSVAWAQNDKVLVSGDSLGHVRVWGLAASPPSCNTVSVRAPSALRLKDRAPALVWAVCVLPDLTVFAADSKGRTHVIDGKMGLVVKSVVAHHGADTLTLVNDGFDVFSAGVDGRLVHYKRVAEQNNIWDWVIAGATRYHTHDVLCLCLAGQYNVTTSEERASGREVAPIDPSNRREKKAPKLDARRTLPCVVSGGLDTQLCVYTYSPTAAKHSHQPLTQAIRLPPWPHEACVSISGLVADAKSGAGGRAASKEVRMVSWHSGSIDLWRWRVDDSADAAGAAAGAVAAAASGGGAGEPRYALRVNTTAEENLTCAAISPDGLWLAFSHPSRLSLYRLSVDPEDRSLDVDKCELPPTVEACGANALVFLHDSKRLAVAAQSGQVLVISLASLEVQASYTPEDLQEEEEEGTQASARGGGGGGGGRRPRPAINRLTVSQDGQWLATCNIEGHVHLLSPEARRLHTSLPSLPAKVTALRFAPSKSLSQQVLVLVTAENRVYLFDVEEARLTAFPPPEATAHSYAPLLSYAHHCYGICFNPAVPGSLMLWGHSFLCHLDLSPEGSSKAGAREVRSSERWKRLDVTEGEAGFKMIHKYSPMLAVDFISGDNLLLVERPWLQVLSQIGGTMYRKRFGK